MRACSMNPLMVSPADLPSIFTLTDSSEPARNLSLDKIKLYGGSDTCGSTWCWGVMSPQAPSGAPDEYEYADGMAQTKATVTKIRANIVCVCDAIINWWSVNIILLLSRFLLDFSLFSRFNCCLIECWQPRPSLSHHFYSTLRIFCVTCSKIHIDGNQVLVTGQPYVIENSHLDMVDLTKSTIALYDFMQTTGYMNFICPVWRTHKYEHCEKWSEWQSTNALCSD